nr:RND family transporter [Methanoregulaceae archaeon]
MIDTIFEGIARSINRKPVLIAGLVATLFCVAIFGMTQITMESGWKTYLDESSEKGIVYAEYTENFQADSTIILIIETSDPLDPAILSYLDNLETDIRQQGNIKGTQSIVGVLKSANGGTLPSSRAEVDRIVGALPPATQQLVNPSNSLTLVQVQLEESVSEDVQRAAMNNVISLVEQTKQPPG